VEYFIKCLQVKNCSCPANSVVSGVLCGFSASANGHPQQHLHMSQEQRYTETAAKEGGTKV